MFDFIQNAISSINGQIANFVTGIFKVIIGLLCSLVLSFVAACSTVMNKIFEMNLKRFNALFPIASKAETYILSLGMAFVFGLFLYALCRNLFSGLGLTAEDPLKLVARYLLATVCVFFSYDAFNTLVTTCFSKPYDEFVKLNSSPSASAWNSTASMKDTFGKWSTSSSLNIYGEEVKDLIIPFIVLVITICIAVNFFKLMVEIAERYLCMCFSVFFSPLAASTLVLESTTDIFKRFIRMFVGQMLLMSANALSIVFVNSALTKFLNDFAPTSNPDILLADGLMLLAFTKVAQHFDNYLKDLGVNAGITGGSMVDEIISTAGTLAGAKDAFANISPAAIGAKASAFKTAASAASSTVGIHPFSSAAFGAAGFAASEAVKNAGGSINGKGKGKVQDWANGGAIFGSIRSMLHPNQSGVADLGKGAERFYNKDGIFAPKEHFSSGAVARAQANTQVGSMPLGDFRFNQSTLKTGPGGVMGLDQKGNLMGMFRQDPSKLDDFKGKVTPITGADGNPYYQCPIDPEKGGEVAKTLQKYYQQGSGTMDVSAIQESITKLGGTPGGTSGGTPDVPTPPTDPGPAPDPGSVSGSSPMPDVSSQSSYSTSGNQSVTPPSHTSAPSFHKTGTAAPQSKHNGGGFTFKK